MPGKQENLRRLPNGGSSAQKPTFFSWLGNLFYSLGFSAELTIVKTWRVVRDIILFIGSLCKLLFGGVFKTIFAFLKAGWHNFTAPFVRFASGFRNMRHLAATKKRGEAPADTTITLYLAKGIKNHAYLLGNLARMVVPVLAFVVFGATFYSVLHMRYGLAVQVDGTNIGYVESETVLEDGLNLLRMRISLAEGQDLSQWEFSPVLSVGPTTAPLDKTQVADKILESSPEKIQKGFGIYVNNQLVGATTNGEELRTFLAQQLAAHTLEDVPEAKASFVRNVVVPQQEEIFLATSVKPVEQLEAKLLENVTEEEDYTTQEGDTLDSIALAHNITLEQLKARNPDLEQQKGNYSPEAGTRLLIRRAEPFLQVQTTYRRSAVEPVEYPTETREVNTRFKGQQVRVQRGVNGEEQVWYEVVVIDGEEVALNRLDDLTVRTKEPVPEILEVGTKEGGVYGSAAGIASIGGGGGGYQWPVPAYTGMSRGFSGAHGALDINAPIGTPIYAANGGVVTYSGEGLGSAWSYGNYVEIQHPDGIVTRYAHCSSVLVTVGQSVGQGQPIALVGSTGRSSGPHCHFETVVGGVRVDPMIYVTRP